MQPGQLDKQVFQAGEVCERAVGNAGDLVVVQIPVNSMSAVAH